MLQFSRKGERMEEGIDAKIEVFSQGKLTVLSVFGELDFSNCKSLREEFIKLKASGQKIVFDLQKTSYMDSEGLKEIINCRRDIARSGGEMVLVCGDAPMRVILLAKLDEFFQICPNLEEATHRLSAH